MFSTLQTSIRRVFTAFALSLLLFQAVPASFATAQKASDKIVRVGWYESSFNFSDQFGRRSGYAYDYQQKIAAYTGWTYEYVKGTWPELFQKLKDGQIDLMSDISYTSERAKDMLFSSLSMGVETFFVFISASNNEIKLGIPATMNGKIVGVNKGSFQHKLFLKWAAENKVQVEVVELTTSEKESIQLLESGVLDAYVSVDGYTEDYTIIPVFKIGYADFYFSVNKSRPDLLSELNVAMSKIQDENKFFNRQLHEKYILRRGASSFLSPEESNWLNKHGSIRVGYWDKYLPFCTSDPETGAVTGALKEYLRLASTCMKNKKINFEAVPYATFPAALEDLRKGVIDCVFPVNLSVYDGEKLSILVTTPFMQTEMYAVMRKSNQLVALPDSELTVAVRVGNPNYEMFIKDNYPKWKMVTFDSIEDCLHAVEEGKVDCALVNNYRAVRSDVLRNNKLSSYTTGAAMRFSFAIRKGESELYSILNKAATFVPVTAVDSALTTYSYQDEVFSFVDFLIEHLALVIILFLTITVLIILFLISRAKHMAYELKERIALQHRILEQERQKHQSDAMITAMASDYRSVFYINLDKDECVCFRAKGEMLNNIHEGSIFPYQETIKLYADTHVVESERSAFLHFVDPDNIRAGLSKEPIIAHRYLSIRDERAFYEMLRIVNIHQSEDTNSVVNTVCVGFSDVDSETREEMEIKRTLSDALTEAEAANVAKTSFLSSMSHEIRTPMNAIIGLNKIALQDSDLSQRTREYLEKIGTSADHLMELINDILDMSRIESGRVTIRNVAFSFREMLEQINTMVNGQCQNKDLHYNFQVIGHVDDYYVGDVMKLKQVLINILGNAVKYTPVQGTVSFMVESQATFEDNTTLRFTIKDTGIGMDEKFLPKIFEPFVQEEEGVSNKFGSTGLGMAITKNIVELMNGKIEVESHKGVGSTFTVTIPLKTTDGTDLASKDDIRPQDLHVLIVDADSKACAHSQRVLDVAGIVADVCHSGQAASDLLTLAQARQQPYNLILADLETLGQDGLHAIRTIRESFEKHTVIILTTTDEETSTDDTLSTEVDSCMVKPIQASDVLQEYRKAILRNESEQKAPHRANLVGKRILLAEDMQINAEIMKEILGMREMEVEHAENGQIATEMFMNKPEGYYNAILMDIRMPVLDGLGATETIRAMDRADSKTIPIIAMTANAFDEDVQRSLQAGMNAHLSKPVEPEKLFETLETLIVEE